MRIIFVNRFYWPSTPATGQLLTDLATGLAARGHHVLVLASRPSSSAMASVEVRDGVHINRITTPSSRHSTVAAKFLAFAAFAFGALLRLLMTVRRDDLVVCLTDPPLFGIPAAIVVGLRRGRLVHWIQDIYPEIATEVSGRRLPQLLAPWRDLVWRRSAACVTVSEDMATVVRLARVRASRVHVIENWAPREIRALDATDPDVLELRRRWGLAGKFVVAYSGNLGRVHDMRPIIAAANALRLEKDIVFVIIGDGAQRCALETAVRAQQLSNVRMLPLQPREQLCASLAVADVHLVTLLPGFERFVFPSKVYGIVASSRPLLFAGNPRCGLARLITESRIGVATDSRNGAELPKVIQQLATQPELCKEYAEASTRFARLHTISARVTAWEQLLQRARSGLS